MLLTIVSLCLDAGVIPVGSQVYLYFVAAQSGIISALCWCLMINGFVGFQLYEDGTRLSVWLLRLSSLLWFVISGLVALATFKGWVGLGPKKTIGLFIVLYILNALFLLIYVVCQILLVLKTLQERWPLGDILFGVLFFTVGQVLLYALSDKICTSVNHYLDGVFFATICNLLGVMMVYKVFNARQLICKTVTSANFWDHSTGIRSPKRIWSSPSARQSWKSRNHSWTTTSITAHTIRTTRYLARETALISTTKGILQRPFFRL